MHNKLERGLVQVYTGDGKGKTTAAIGLAMRALGNGLKVYMIQFMKGQIFYGELKIAEMHSPDFVIKQCGRSDFVNPRNPEAIDIKLAEEALEHAKKIVSEGSYDIVILDEVNVALKFGLIKLEGLIELIKTKPAHVELILTGRYAQKEVIDLADLVTEMRAVKHYYDKGVQARVGIER
jgi:cob(I)alamin adenosyltransferase